VESGGGEVSAPKDVRERRAGIGWVLFVAALVAALLAIWQWDQRWLATAGVLLFAAGAFGLGSWS
jgi:fatty acid desaturase